MSKIKKKGGDDYSEMEQEITNMTENAILGRFFRRIIRELNYTNRLGYLVDRYFKRARLTNDLDQLKKTKSSLRNNIVSDRMTWKVFLDLIFKLLWVKKCVIRMEITYQNDTTSIHDYVILPGDYTSTEEETNTEEKENKNA